MGHWVTMPCNLYHDDTEVIVPTAKKALRLHQHLGKMRYRQYRIAQLLCAASRTGVSDVSITPGPFEWKVKPVGFELTLHL